MLKKVQQDIMIMVKKYKSLYKFSMTKTEKLSTYYL